MNNPFKKKTNQYKDFKTLSDLEWHCTKCELKSTQAKTWQIWRQERGIQFDTDDKGNFYKWVECKGCGRKTVHRKLKSLEMLEVGLTARSDIPPKIKKKAKELFEFVDEYTLRKESANQLEIDHRIPQIRWKASETQNSELSDEEIKEKFMLLTRANNLLKSRCCEKCKETGKRAKGYKVIEFWYLGNEEYTEEIGCNGCFWYNPSKWRIELNKKIN